MISRAILLLAGRGRRLGSLTANRPKCLLEVGGMSILERALQSLSEGGVSEAILVVGHRKDQVRRIAGLQYAGMEIRYVANDRHAETNTAYSLWLARSYLNTDCLLVEGDILFDVGTLERAFGCFRDRSVWTAIPVAPGYGEGILLRQNQAGNVTVAQLVGRAEHDVPDLVYKCAGIQLLATTMAQALAANLDVAIANRQFRTYADLVLGELLTETSMKLCSLEGLRWAEVDSLEDLYRAQQLYKVKERSSVLSLKKLQDGEAEHEPAS